MLGQPPLPSPQSKQDSDTLSEISASHTISTMDTRVSTMENNMQDMFNMMKEMRQHLIQPDPQTATTHENRPLTVPGTSTSPAQAGERAL